ncbi:serine O-acetyltransferase [Cyanobium sp. ATX 6F1]|uniref:serine O-acetyltransferase n=1 Tax=unclassified Cyanobium TaxID=2627006 RepID=UPI0020CCEFE5|nr:DapH/DapD/GlmU-related protein [Cyanobium sp. ATX 6F1]MCP9916640.1 hypothetical protein [Cyanobium sp. ATX 6F1]
MTISDAGKVLYLGTVNLVHADLIRQFQLIYGQEALPSCLQLWISGVSPRYLPVLLYRLSHSFYRHNLGILAKSISFLNFAIFGIEISVSCPIGPGLFLPHTQGTVIGAWRIGSNATIFQGVTIGARDLDFMPSLLTRPSIGDCVSIGAGAVVLGGIHLGNGSQVGANSVVLASVPSGYLAVGSPARNVNSAKPIA